MPPATILVIDDEPQIRRVVKHAAESGDTRVIEATTAKEGIDLAAAERPALIVLDIGLPDSSGVDVCREIRSWSSVPILVLTAHHSDEEKVALLDAGADDYVTKPFSTTEFQARVRALLRRAAMAASTTGATQIRADGLEIDLLARSVRTAAGLVHVTPVEWELLKTLATHAGRTMTHRQLFNAVWSGRSAGDAQQYLRVHVAHLRRKIEADPLRPRFILTEPGVGYRFSLEG